MRTMFFADLFISIKLFTLILRDVSSLGMLTRQGPAIQVSAERGDTLFGKFIFWERLQPAPLRWEDDLIDIFEGEG